MPDSLSLSDVCDGVLQNLCRLNRLARLGARLDPQQVRQEMRGALNAATGKAGASPGLPELFNQVRPALLATTDWVIRTSRLSWARQWESMAAEEGYRDADAKFFQMVDELLRDPSDGATQKLAVLYSCIGLGYTGIHAGAPETLRRKMVDISVRIRSMMEADDAARMTPDAYEHTNRSVLTEKPTGTVTRSVVLLVGIALVVVAAVIVGSRQAGATLERAVDDILTATTKGAK